MHRTRVCNSDLLDSFLLVFSILVDGGIFFVLFKRNNTKARINRFIDTGLISKNSTPSSTQDIVNQIKVAKLLTICVSVKCNHVLKYPTMSSKHDDDIEFLAPENFSMVETGVYRSAFPRTKNIEFLKRLNLKSVVSLVPEDYPVAMQDFYNANGITLISVGLDGNKWPFKEIDHEGMQEVLTKILNPRNRPLLIHCNKGKHRTGSVVGCLRRIRGWALSAVFTEYLLMASPKTRLEDQQLIELFQYRHNQEDKEAEVMEDESADGGIIVEASAAGFE